jgi:hypothetical protein
MRVTAVMRRFGVVTAAVALASVAGLAGTAEAAQGPRAKVTAETTATTCGTPTTALRLSAARKQRPTATAALGGFDIAKWLGEKVAGGAAGAAGGLAFNEVLQLSGLKDKLMGPDPILARLQGIETQLKGVNERLDQITGLLNDLNRRVVVGQLHDTLSELCGKVVDVQDLYVHNFIPSVLAGVQLGQIWTAYPNADAQKYVGTMIADLPDDVRHKVYPEAGDAGCSDPTDRTQLVCDTPTQLVKYRLDKFRSKFDSRGLGTAAGFISNHLQLHSETRSLMTDYGAYLMTKRTLTRVDSAALRAMYDQFAEQEALAAWMAMEYYASDPAGGVNPNSALKAYGDGKTQEALDLSPMIPEGVVVDLGQPNAVSTRNHSIWSLASTDDTTYWPINAESNNLVTTTADGAGNAIKAFNSQACPDDASEACFTDWKIPSTAELKSLLSENCALNTTKNPPTLPTTCKPIVNGAVGSPNVVKYLASLDTTNLTWNTVFCAGLTVPVSCAGQHYFVWTTDRRSHETKCAYEEGIFGIHLPLARTYSLRAGLPLNFTNTNAVWPIYPIMDAQVNPYGVAGVDEGHARCDVYARAQIADPKNQGIVLATYYNRTVDFMAQTASSAVEQKSAQNVVQDAAAAARQYGRRHHGQFSGLKLDRPDDDIPDPGSGEPAYLVNARAIDGGAGFTVTAQGAATNDTFTITRRASGAVQRTCTRVGGRGSRHSCRHLRGRRGRW